MPPVRHIVFDIGRVLIRWEPELGLLEAIPDAERRAWFLATICNHDWVLEQDRGRPWPEGEALLIERHPDWAGPIRAFRRNWPLMVPGAIEDSVALMEGLVAAGHDVTMLTNFAADTYGLAQGMFPFLATPRGVTVSGEHGLVKPERAIYALHASRFGLDPAATLFIDDSPSNVHGARAAGWQAVPFHDAAGLAADLSALCLRWSQDGAAASQP